MAPKLQKKGGETWAREEKNRWRHHLTATAVQSRHYLQWTDDVRRRHCPALRSRCVRNAGSNQSDPVTSVVWAEVAITSVSAHTLSNPI